MAKGETWRHFFRTVSVLIGVKERKIIPWKSDTDDSVKHVPILSVTPENQESIRPKIVAVLVVCNNAINHPSSCYEVE